MQAKRSRKSKSVQNNGQSQLYSMDSSENQHSDLDKQETSFLEGEIDKKSKERVKKYKENSINQQSYENGQNVVSSLRATNKRKSRNQLKKKSLYRDQQCDESDEQFKEYYTGGRVEKVFGERLRQGSGTIQKLCKVSTSSYLHLEWLTDEELKQRNIKETFKRQNSRKNNAEVSQIPKSFTEIDQVISCANMFPILYPKKSQQIQNSWELIFSIILQKLLNYEQFNIPYGANIQKALNGISYEEELQMISENDRELLKEQISYKFEHLLSKVYFRQIKCWKYFWNDVGTCLKYYFEEKQEEEPTNDIQLIAQCAIFLYWQAYTFFLLKEPHKSVKFRQTAINFIFKDTITSKISQSEILAEQLKEIDSHYDFSYIKQTPPEIDDFNFQWLPQKMKIMKISEEPLEQGLIAFTLRLENLYLKQKCTDTEKLNIFKKVDTLYLIKWKDLSYSEATWERESQLMRSNGEQGTLKIQQFKNFNRLPSKKIRNKLQEYYLYYQSLSTSSKVKNPLEISKLFTPYSLEQPPIYKNYRTLKSFQVQSLNWLIKNFKNSRNCILGDEMGLGKTIQTIAFLQHLFTHQNLIGPFLIVVPVSTIKQWKNQINAWSDFNVVMYKGNREQRQFIAEHLFSYSFVNTEGWFVSKPTIYKFHILLTNYETFAAEFEKFKQIPFQFIVIDEAHRIKNQNTKLSKTLKLLSCKKILLLTGTPFQNNPSQLWGLLNFIEPQKFCSFDAFQRKFGMLKTVDEVKELQETLGPYLMRRVKSDVEKSIPKLSQILVTLELTRLQKTYYRGILEQNKNNLLQSLNKVQLNNISICLRKCCNHPYLLSDQVREEVEAKTSVENYPQKLVESSCKFQFLLKLLKPTNTNITPKTLIFTQFIDSLNLLSQFCEIFSIRYQFLDGSVGFEQRQKRIDRFNTSDSQKEVKVFIISTKAGGTGINLTSASCVVIFDSDWNPHNDLQAIARAHRIGQKNPVTVYRLIVGNTYEQVIYTSAVKKLGVGMAVLGDYNQQNDEEKAEQKKQESSDLPNPRPRRGRKKIVKETGKNPDQDKKPDRKIKNKDEIEKLLKDGVLGFLKNENTEQAVENTDNFTIEQLIADKGRVINYQTKDCSFLKTNFKHSAASTDNHDQQELKLDDKNFWEVALKNVESPLQKFIKKYENIFKSGNLGVSELLEIKKQGDFMIECNEIVEKFLKSKIELKGYNIQDEKEIKNLLLQIFQNKFFVNDFRKIANYWFDEIQKPSRRYEKIKKEDITKIIKEHAPKVIHEKPPKKNRQKKQKIEKEEYIQKNATKNENRDLPQPVSTYLPQSTEQQIMFEELEEQRNKMLLQQLCSFCEQKRCSKFCSKLCKRYFHDECYEKLKNGRVQPNKKIIEGSWSDEKVLKYQAKIFECYQCALGQIRCCICDKSDESVPFIKKSKHQKKKQEQEDPTKMTEINKIIKICQKSSHSKAFQCQFPNCHKFYHLKCLAQMQTQLMYEIQLTIFQEEEFYKLKCPIHYCSKCHRKIMSSGLRCIRCPIAYHQKCFNKSLSTIISGDKFICKVHKNEEEKILEGLLDDGQERNGQNEKRRRKTQRCQQISKKQRKDRIKFQKALQKLESMESQSRKSEQPNSKINKIPNKQPVSQIQIPDE